MNIAKIVLIAAVLYCPVDAFAFQYQEVADKARALAAQPFKEFTDKDIPDVIKDMGYDQWRGIRFKSSNTIWGDSKVPFKLQFFHLNGLYRRPISVHYIEQHGRVKDIPFSTDLFDYGKDDVVKKIPKTIGFAGFRIHYPINTPGYPDEVVAFLGASYFRAVAKKERYGLSARGLAVNTATASGEDFPVFKEFWILEPSVRSKDITVYALMDSPNVTGAYTYVIQPGDETIMKVKSLLFFRNKVEKVGIAPMTSMFFYGEGGRVAHEDFRPEVHDSDGVLINTQPGEWIWRPLINPSELLINTFEVGTPKGFGLMQRDTDFDHYQDLEARFDLRPSVWIVPDKDWGDGYVELLQIPSTNEDSDNMNVFWVPRNLPQAGDVREFAYTMHWASADIKRSPLGFAAKTRLIRRGRDRAQFVVDFEGGSLTRIKNPKDIAGDIFVGKGARILDYQVYRNDVTGGWRMVLQIALDNEDPIKTMMPDRRPPVELRAFLRNVTGALTETWTYTFLPEQ